MTVFVAVLASLMVIAYLSPEPDRVTDRGVYEATADRFIVQDCADLHCFRVLVPWVLGSIPGSSQAKWKIYAVFANSLAALAVMVLAEAWALTPRQALMAARMLGIVEAEHRNVAAYWDRLAARPGFQKALA